MNILGIPLDDAWMGDQPILQSLLAQEDRSTEKSLDIRVFSHIEFKSKIPVF
jgi:hypothetical protein